MTGQARLSIIERVATIGIRDARKRLSQLVDKAAAGEDVIVSRHGKPIVRITRLAEGRPGVRFGVLAGQVRVDDDFDAPVPDEVQTSFEGR